MTKRRISEEINPQQHHCENLKFHKDKDNNIKVNFRENIKSIYVYFNTLHKNYVNLLTTKCNLLYIRNQSILRSKHFPPRL